MKYLWLDEWHCSQCFEWFFWHHFMYKLGSYLGMTSSAKKWHLGSVAFWAASKIISLKEIMCITLNVLKWSLYYTLCIFHWNNFVYYTDSILNHTQSFANSHPMLVFSGFLCDSFTPFWYSRFWVSQKDRICQDITSQTSLECWFGLQQLSLVSGKWILFYVDTWVDWWYMIPYILQIAPQFRVSISPWTVSCRVPAWLFHQNAERAGCLAVVEDRTAMGCTKFALQKKDGA